MFTKLLGIHGKNRNLTGRKWNEVVLLYEEKYDYICAMHKVGMVLLWLLLKIVNR